MNKFEGFDWTELGYEWNLYTEEDDLQDKEMEEKIINYIQNNYEKNLIIILDMREYLKTLVKLNFACEIPLWKGLLKIKDDEVFLGYYCKLLRSMWC